MNRNSFTLHVQINNSKLWGLNDRIPIIRSLKTRFYTKPSIYFMGPRLKNPLIDGPISLHHSMDRKSRDGLPRCLRLCNAIDFSQERISHLETQIKSLRSLSVVPVEIQPKAYCRIFMSDAVYSRQIQFLEKISWCCQNDRFNSQVILKVSQSQR